MTHLSQTGQLPADTKRESVDSHAKPQPTIGLALSGGGSRAIAFHLGCLRALSDLSVLDRVKVISTISGGSVLGAYYAYTPNKSFGEFETEIRASLRRGFQRDVAYELLKPTTLIPCVAGWLLAKVNEALAQLLGWTSGPALLMTRTDVLEKVLSKRLFSGLTMASPRRKDVKVVIGACELGTGTAFRFGDEKTGDWRHGVLDIGCIPVSLAVTASAAYPLFLPCLDRMWWFRKGETRSRHRITLTDGGVYDNLGIQVLEPDRNAAVSLHTFPCDYLIVCHAGTGPDGGDKLGTGFYRRVKRSVEVIHRRVQDSSMHRLHQLADANLIKGFAMPYLGQIDERLPRIPSSFVKREAVMNYPTNFGAMSDEWIEKLSARGEQLTHILVSHYLSALLNIDPVESKNSIDVTGM